MATREGSSQAKDLCPHMATRVRTTRISERISDSIKRQIATGRLTAGARLPAEREMARRKRVSRVSVREAYRSLEELGLLTIRRGAEGGAFVVEPDETSIQESLSLLLRLRVTSTRELNDAWMIEPTIARLAARNARAADIGRLRRALERGQAAAANHAYAGLDWLRFQRAVAKCARNLPLMALMNSLADVTLTSGSFFEAGRLSADRISRSHQAIFEAIEQHNEDAAHQLMRQHMALVQNGFVDMVPASPLGAA